MMRNTFPLLITTFLFMSAGCAESENGLADDDPSYIVDAPSLLGDWYASENGKEALVWRVERTKGKYYALTGFNNYGEKVKLYILPVKIADTIFLDIADWEKRFGKKDAAKKPQDTHLILKVEQTKPDLKWSPIRLEFIKKHPEVLPHRLHEGFLFDSVTITATSKQLREFCKKYKDTDEAWKSNDDPTFRMYQKE